MASIPHRTTTDPAVASAPTRRRHYRPPAGIPAERERWTLGAVMSLLVHLAIILLILFPLGFSHELREMVQGAGGAGPAGGGGGGRGGSGGAQHVVERLTYIVPQRAPAPTPPVTPPVQQPPQQQTPLIPKIDIRTDAPKQQIDIALTAGIGGGTGHDGSSGNGPGTGGGVGSGVGTGRGSNVGPGTGGGPGTIYPPTPVQTVLPPMPVPEKLRGREIVANFTVDERGHVLSIDFTHTGDRDYDRRLLERFRTYTFRPATKWDGTPVKAIGQVTLYL